MILGYSVCVQGVTPALGFLSLSLSSHCFPDDDALYRQTPLGLLAALMNHVYGETPVAGP